MKAKFRVCAICGKQDDTVDEQFRCATHKNAPLPKPELDLNRDGKVDEKDKSLAGKVLGSKEFKGEKEKVETKPKPKRRRRKNA